MFTFLVYLLYAHFLQPIYSDIEVYACVYWQNNNYRCGKLNFETDSREAKYFYFVDTSVGEKKWQIEQEQSAVIPREIAELVWRVVMDHPSDYTAAARIRRPEREQRDFRVQIITYRQCR